MSQNEKKSVDAAKYDQAMTADQAGTPDAVWRHAFEEPFRLTGFPWYAQDELYRRMPLEPEKRLPEAVDNLAWHTAGGQVQFISDSSRVAVRVQLRGPHHMVHMADTGQSGFDLYVGEPGEKTYYHTTKFEYDALEYELLMFECLDKAEREFTLNFPLFNGVMQLEIGLDPEAVVKPPTAYEDDRPVVIYGTSITHGGCASRPGLAYPNILSRMINVPIINLGFSGSGQAEPEVAHTIAQLPAPRMLVVDCEANNSPDGQLEERVPVFINLLREFNPDVPILLISRIPNIHEDVQAEQKRKRLERVRFQEELVAKLKADGDEHIYFQDGSELLEPYGHEGTVDATHPNDIGFLHMADNLQPVFSKLLGI